MKSKLLQLLMMSIFALGAMTMKAQTYASGNLLVNPGCEAPAATGTVAQDDKTIPDGWDSVRTVFFDKCYAGYKFSSGVNTTPRGGGSATKNTGTIFFTANGSTIIDVLRGNFVGRLPATQTRGLYQPVDVTPGATYVFGCKIGVRTTDASAQTIKGTEGVKIVNPVDNSIIQHVYISDVTTVTDPIVCDLENTVTIPEGIYKIFFQVDNVSMAGTTTEQSPLVCFDECYFRKIQPGPNLLKNPGFEDYTDMSADTLPTKTNNTWSPIAGITWFTNYYSGGSWTHFYKANLASVNSVQQTPANQIFFKSTAGYGAPIVDILMGNRCGRLPNTNSSGMFQVVTIPGPGKYAISVRIAYNENTGTIQENTIKILDPVNNTKLIGEVPIPTDKTAGHPFIVTGVVNIPAGYSQVRFQLDQRDFSGTSPVMLFDDCDFYQLPDFVVDADGPTRSASEYTSGDYGDIIINSNETSTGQLTDIPAAGLPVNGVVKFVKPFTAGKWYPIGFPFAVDSVNTTYEGADYKLWTYDVDGKADDGTSHGDFWLKTYDGNAFNYYNDAKGSESIDAGGYVLQVPAGGLDKLPITFTSESGITLTSSTTCASLPGGYLLTNNPSYMNNDLTSAYPVAGINYYTYGTGGDANFGLNHSTYTLKPFESVVVEDGSGSLRSSLGIDAVTALPSLNLPNDKVVATEYYNLMGVKVAQPAKGNIYVIKTIFESGKTSVVKQFIENN